MPASAASSQKLPTVKVTPQVRSHALPDITSGIPLDKLRPFLSEVSVLPEECFKCLPEILAIRDEHVAVGTRDAIYALVPHEIGQHWHIVRKGTVYTLDPEGPALGAEAVHLGNARVTQLGHPSQLIITDSKTEILPGDRLLPKKDPILLPHLVPKVPDSVVPGKILAVERNITQIGQYHIIVVSGGKDVARQVGDKLVIFRNKPAQLTKGQLKKGLVIPEDIVGEIVIFRVFENLSYALITRATAVIHLRDTVGKP